MPRRCTAPILTGDEYLAASARLRAAGYTVRVLRAVFPGRWQIAAVMPLRPSPPPRQLDLPLRIPPGPPHRRRLTDAQAAPLFAALRAAAR